MKTTQKGKQSANYANSRENLISENSRNSRTNIPWLKEVPKGWEVKSARVLFSENNRTNLEMETSNALQFQFGEIIPKKRLETDENLSRYTIVEKDDIMVNGLNLNYDFLTQRVAIVKEKGAITPAYISLRPTKLINPMYACYLLKAMDSQKIINGMGTGIRLTLSFSEFKKTEFPLPPLSLQTQIVNFLDAKVSAIDRLMEAKRRQIELLKEWKRAAINEELKEGCKKVRLKRVVRDVNEKSAPSEQFYIGMENIVSWCGTFVETKINVEGDCKRFKQGDILFGKLRPYLAKAYIPETDGICSGEFLVLRDFKEYLPFLKYFLLSYDFIMLVNASTYGAKMPRANWDFIGNCAIALPPLAVQQEIVKKLDEKCAQADRLLAKLQDEISLFAEYKTRLINDVVTGKVDVQNSVATSVIKSVVTQAQVIDFVPKQSKSHSKGYEDAVILAALVNAFGTEQYPFTAFDCQKFPYLLHRHIEGVAENYNKFAAGPYNPELKYKTARPIALKRKYIRGHTGLYKGFIADENIFEAMKYFTEWYGNEPLEWIKQFRFIKNRKNELELLATVDMAIVELREKNMLVTMLSVKELIMKSPTWKDKLSRPVFSDDNIERAIKWSYKLFGNY